MIATLWSQEVVPLSRSNRVALGGHYDLSKGSYSVLQESVESCSFEAYETIQRTLDLCDRSNRSEEAKANMRNSMRIDRETVPLEESSCLV